eukprot:scaffold648049_cov46-Prasinocladus_malaysianus.AAC.1
MRTATLAACRWMSSRSGWLLRFRAVSSGDCDQIVLNDRHRHSSVASCKGATDEIGGGTSSTEALGIVIINGT